MFVQLPSFVDFLLGHDQQLPGRLGVALDQHGVAGLVVDVLVQGESGRLRIQSERILALLGQVPDGLTMTASGSPLKCWSGAAA
jgi:hypothetical protein